jgi:hypothetical protein
MHLRRPHAAVYVRDMEDMLDFHSNLLGFRSIIEATRTEFGDGPEFQPIEDFCAAQLEPLAA